VSRKYAHKIPFIVKLNHHQLLRYPNKHDHIMFASASRQVTRDEQREHNHGPVSRAKPQGLHYRYR